MGRFALLVTLALVGSVHGWGEVGHKAIAELARDKLSSASKAAVAHYLGSMEMYQVAPQPDDYAFSPAGHWSEPFHFYNMDRGDISFHFSECPNPPSCNVYAIQNFTKALASQGGSGPFCSSENDPTNVFPCPLIWLIHVVGDVHQPLHCGYGYDRGGNEVNCTFFGKPTELHAVWDTEMIYHYLDPTNGDWYDLYKYLAADLAKNPAREKAWAKVTDVVAWANESISYVINDVYRFHSGSTNNNLDDPALGDWYYQHNFPIAVQRMQAAAVRLAAIINNIFGNFTPAKPALPAHFQRSAEYVRQQLQKQKAQQRK